MKDLTVKNEVVTTEERCVRCGREGPDLRTLKMSCFYAMDEDTEVPYQEINILEARKYSAGEEIPTFLNEVCRVPTFEDKDDNGDIQTAVILLLKSTAFTLRVCKTCRAEWMAAQRAWFKRPPVIERNLGTGIFVRKNGATVEVTEEEYQILYPGRTPIRFKPGTD
jgi:hypothetical protein